MGKPHAANYILPTGSCVQCMYEVDYMYQDEISIIEMVVQYMCMYVVCSLSFTQIQAPYKEFQRLQENILDFN